MSAAVGTYEQVSLGAIAPSTTNPRKNFDDAGMADLTASVREVGVQQPILLRPTARGRFFAKAGDLRGGASVVVYLCHPKSTNDGQYNIVETFSAGTKEENFELVTAEAEERNRSKGFEIVCGERRFRAAKAAGLETIPAIVRELDDETAYQAQIIENLQREDLGPLGHAMEIAKLAEEEQADALA